MFRNENIVPKTSFASSSALRTLPCLATPSDAPFGPVLGALSVVEEEEVGREAWGVDAGTLGLMVGHFILYMHSAGVC